MLFIQVYSSVIYKAFSMAFILFIPYLFTKEFTETQYGLWSIYQSSVMWFLLMDLGLGNALVNKLPEEKTYSNRLDLLCFTNKLSIYITLLILILNTILYIIINNYDPYLYIGLSMISLCIPFNIVGKYWTYRKKSQNIELYSLISNILFCAFASILFITNSLTLNISIVSFAFILLLTKLYFFLKTSTLKNSLLISLRNLNKFNIKGKYNFLNISINFFVCQVTSISILLGIRYFFAYNDMFEYAGLFDILFRPGTIAIMLCVLILRPIWIKLLEHYLKRERTGCIKLLLSIFLIYILYITSIIIFQKTNVLLYLFNIWTPELTSINLTAINTTLAFTSIVILNNIISYIMNGLNLIKAQMYLNMIGIIICLIYFLTLSNEYSYDLYPLFFSFPFTPLIIIGSILIYRRIKKL